MNNVGAIILAAGKGKRMNSKNFNKVVHLLNGKPMIIHPVEMFESLGLKPIVVVVGFAKKSVVSAVGNRVIFAHQSKILGTGHAVSCGLKKLTDNTKNVLVVNGDDSAFYTAETISELINEHVKKEAALSFLTINVDNPFGLGRIIRDANGNTLGVVEEKDATDDQRKIEEVIPGCYVFSVSFLRKYLKKVKKSMATGEYYLTSLIDLAIRNNEKVEAIKGGKISWRGINTPKELKEAEQLFSQN